MNLVACHKLVCYNILAWLPTEEQILLNNVFVSTALKLSACGFTFASDVTNEQTTEGDHDHAVEQQYNNRPG